MHHVRDVGADVATCLAPDGLVVDEVHEAVSIAVERPTDRCLIEQICVADLWVVHLLEDVLAGRPFMTFKTCPVSLTCNGCTAVGWLSSNS